MARGVLREMSSMTVSVSQVGYYENFFPRKSDDAVAQLPRGVVESLYWRHSGIMEMWY